MFEDAEKAPIKMIDMEMVLKYTLIRCILLMEQ